MSAGARAGERPARWSESQESVNPDSTPYTFPLSATSGPRHRVSSNGGVERDGTQAAAQIKPFEDTWRWDEGAARAFEEAVEVGGRVSQAMPASAAVLCSAATRRDNTC